ncbi:hypothetical protein HBH64_136880 [Parastagonospora nodorum]|nr:hypothetical protein HBH50_111550 [Parastagonospora nodorum]KAH4088380.1 hypothetical protein HBH48_128520 [Parastagonospora nodorum]KAH4304246.1 hypothetical protein HBI01_074910 [Parastagonospora nodorum]KAH4317529.1 hypothetical protein HBI02_025910 [Parastagonospora nodorum]KAH4330040.1 hypothetical protein HBI00_085050 [Parastagonospora nodorum]
MVDQISQLPTGALEFTTLSAKVKALTGFLIDGAILPETLKQHGTLLLAFTAGAAAASATLPYFNRYRNDRAKVNLAVFHITRIIENTSEYQDRLRHPHELVRVMDAEVQRLLQIHLNKQEAQGAMSALKRKLWVELDEERALLAKRRKSETAERKDSVVTGAPEMQETYAELSQPSPTTTPAPEVFRPLSGRKDKLLASAAIKEKEDSIMTDVDALVETLATPLRQEKKAVTTPSTATKTPLAQVSQTPLNPLSSVLNSSKKSPEETFLDYASVMRQAASPFPPNTPGMEQAASLSPSLPARPPTRRGGYDSSPPSTSKELQPSSGRSTYKYPSFSTSEGGSIASAAQAPAVHASPTYGLNYNDEDLYSSSSSPTASTKASPTGQQTPVDKPSKPLRALQQALMGARNLNTPGHMLSDPLATEKRKTSKPPSTIKIQQPPNSMVGVSPHESPTLGTTQYRVAESKIFYWKIEDNRKERRDMHKFLKQKDEIMQEAEVLPAKKDEEWPNATLTYSSTEETSQVSLSASLPSIRSIASPPSAPAISLPRPSPADQPQTPLQASPSSSSDLSLLPLDANFSSPVETKDEAMSDVIYVGSAPVVRDGLTKDEDMDDVVFVSSTPARREEVTPPRTTLFPPKKRGRPKKVMVEQKEVTVVERKPDTPMPAKRLGRPTKAASKLQTPATPVATSKRGRSSRQGTAELDTPVQLETPSGRAVRTRAFKGSYKA